MATWWCTYLLNWWSHTYIHDCIYQCKSRRKQLALLCSHSIWEKEGNWLYVYIKNFSWLTFIHVEWNRNFSLKYGKSKASVNSGAPNGSVPQNICSSGQFLLAGRFGKSNMSLEVKCCWEILPYDYTLTSQQCLLGNLLAVNSSISVAGFGNR